MRWVALGTGLTHCRAGDKVMNALFQSVSTRTAGINSIDLYTMEPAVQVLIMAMMYLSGIPVVLSIRSSTEEAWDVQERRKHSLPAAAAPARSVVRHQLKQMLQLDLAFVVGVWFVLVAVEQAQVTGVGLRPKQFSAPLRHALSSANARLAAFQVLFEVLSAYGTVGLSLSATSLSVAGSFHSASKLLLMLVMLAGRHRGLGLLLPSTPPPPVRARLTFPAHLDHAFRIRKPGAHASVSGPGSARNSFERTSFEAQL